MNAIIYDGDCPFCTNYVKFVRLQEAIGPVELINARDNMSLARELDSKGCNLDDGMVLLLDGQLFHGADCVEKIALLSTPVGAFNRLNQFVFRHRLLARVLYPILRMGRNTFLSLAGIRKIHAGRPV